MSTQPRHLLPAFAAACGLALAGPALAQSAQPGGSGSNSSAGSQSQPSGQPQASSQGNRGAASQSSSSQSSSSQAMGREQIRQQLSQAGFRDVQILDTAYLVQARTNDGNTVTMIVNPPGSGMQTSGSGMSQRTGSATGSTGSSSGGSQGQSPSQGSGSGQTR